VFLGFAAHDLTYLAHAPGSGLRIHFRRSVAALWGTLGRRPVEPMQVVRSGFGLSCDDPHGRASVVNRRPTVQMVPPGERLGVPGFPQGRRASAQRVRVGGRMSRAR
jgi:hypothetical protein